MQYQFCIQSETFHATSNSTYSFCGQKAIALSHDKSLFNTYELTAHSGQINLKGFYHFISEICDPGSTETCASPFTEP